MNTLTVAIAKKTLNESFKKQTVKFENRDGKMVSLRDGNDKLIRLIPTGVQLSPMDCTNVKQIKIQNKLSDVCNVLKRLGMIDKGNNIFTHEWMTNKGEFKSFTAYVSVDRYEASRLLDPGYKDVYISVTFI